MNAKDPPPPPAPPGSGAFELDDLPAPRVPAPPAPAPPEPALPEAPEQAHTAADARARVQGPSPRGPAAAANVGPSELTFAEKHGQAVERVAGVRDMPPGWPKEALGYPLRGAGAGYLLGACGALFALDLLGWPAGLRFLAWLLKAPALLFVVRWQLDLAGMSAGGRDQPVGFQRALSLERQDLNAYVRFLLWFAVTMLPSRVLWLLGPHMLGFLHDTAALEVALLVLGSAWLAVIALAMAVEEPSLRRPWITVVWLVRRPFHLLAASLGWWGLGAAEVGMDALAGAGEGATIPAGVVLRAASVYLLMLSARVLGVLGRRVDAGRIGPA